MTDNRIYIEDIISSVNKKNNYVCGDYTAIRRYPNHTDFVLCDGIGSGAKANIYAIMCGTRLLELMSGGASILHAAEKTVDIMHRAKQENMPYAAFTIIRIQNSGKFIVLSYQIPQPILIYDNYAQVLKQRHFTLGNEIVSEAVGTLKKGMAIVLTSDGVTQAGLGVLPGLGWGIDNFCGFLNTKLNTGYSIDNIGESVLNKTKELSGDINGDDTTIAVLKTRSTNRVNLLTGPPVDRNNDESFIKAFMDEDGKHIICGSTTADVAARVLKKGISTLDFGAGFTRPPRYSIDGIDIVSEGAVTLNQVYNIIDEDPNIFQTDSIVSDICKTLLSADYIKLFVGSALNDSHETIAFTQVGVLIRSKIVKKLVAKLKDMGKIVLVING